MKKSFLVLCSMLLVFQCSGSRPQILGVESGKLTACPKTPNCISSFSETSDETHFRSPIVFKKPLSEAKAVLKAKINLIPRTEIITEKPDYIYAEFTSFLMRYVDDVEFYFDEKNKLLHFRSASRLGSGDWGVNRKRIETILKDLDI
jgi:uncharacterized protein (DUF1499 family)